jgi:hypothetical protein
MRTMLKTLSAALLLSTALFNPAQALTMSECSAKYKAAKDAGTLNGQPWNDFRRAECGDAPATTAATTPMTCEALVGHCTPFVDVWCVQTMSGVLAVHHNICAPQLTSAAASGVFVHWAETHGKLLNMSGWDCMAKSYAEAFPCQK